MITEFKAIETRYKGYRFRSRLEARWAVFFDVMNVPWRYEVQGFDLPSGRYLPDFFIPNPMPEWPQAGYWAEIKPASWIDGQDKTLDVLRDLCQTTKHTSYVLVGDPGDFSYRRRHHLYDEWLTFERNSFFDFRGTDEYRRVNFAMWLVHSFTHEVRDNAGEGILAARGARFEFGESGAP